MDIAAAEQGGDRAHAAPAHARAPARRGDVDSPIRLVQSRIELAEDALASQR
jgi:hypothetical protein